MGSKKKSDRNTSKLSANNQSLNRTHNKKLDTSAANRKKKSNKSRILNYLTDDVEYNNLKKLIEQQEIDSFFDNIISNISKKDKIPNSKNTTTDTSKKLNQEDSSQNTSMVDNQKDDQSGNRGKRDQNETSKSDTVNEKSKDNKF